MSALLGTDAFAFDLQMVLLLCLVGYLASGS
jgi:hypothetical protein